MISRRMLLAGLASLPWLMPPVQAGDVPALVAQLSRELEGEGWQRRPSDRPGIWRLDAPAQIGTLHLAIHHRPERRWLALYALYPRKLVSSEREALLARLAAVNHALPAGVNFELDLADGDLRCKLGLDDGRGQLDMAALRHGLYLLAASYLQRSPVVFATTAQPQPAALAPPAALAKATPPSMPGLDAIAAAMRQQGWPAEPDAAGPFIQTAYAQDGRRIPLLVSLDRPLASLLVEAYPGRALRVPASRLAQAARWLALANYGLPLGAFDLAAGTGRLSFRHAQRLPAAALLAPCLHDALMVASVAMYRQLPQLDTLLEDMPR
ncbi:hypothetical protein [Chitinilyticum piscinae]|uniref:YbjN domain-containing protein n=1 Tax=Chitinilyticum piscinae TaxID=2866724 RepID=A0A8J7K0E8_9NEIS|nr:hypothetical protein [Chitinilyticum piscinae]MBE9607901.1 hypothetical protein [Chitinilyticum piscinae]